MSTQSPSQPYLQHTSEPEVAAQSAGPINIGENERLLSAVGGAALALLGLRQRSLGGLLVAAAGGALIHRGLSGHCNVYSKLGLSSSRPASPGKYFRSGIHVDVVTTIGRPAADLYAYWRDFTNLPKIMNNLESVQVLDEKRSRWTAKGPAGTTVSWDAEIINDEPNALIAWRSLAGATVDNAGSVRFIPAPGDRGTEVRVVLDYIPPGRGLGHVVAKLFMSDPQHEIEQDIRRFRQLMETGEITTAKGQPRGTCGSENN